MTNFLRDLALAHQRHEGYFPGSPAYINNNPGNIRGKGGAFIYFATYAQGLMALEWDLKAKIYGTAGSILRFMKGTGKVYLELVFQDYVSIYAPSADHNNPIAYCNALCKDLVQYKVQPSTPLFILAQLVKGELGQVPDPPAPEMSLDLRLISAQNALKWASPERASMLRRLIERIQKRLGIS